MNTATKSVDLERAESAARGKKNLEIAAAKAAQQRRDYEAKLIAEFAARIVSTGARMLEPTLARRPNHGIARHCLAEARKFLLASLETQPDEGA